MCVLGVWPTFSVKVCESAGFVGAILQLVATEGVEISVQQAGITIE